MLRTLRESDEYRAQLKKIGNAERLDDALRMPTWVLARRPEIHPEIAGSVRLLKTTALGGVPALNIFFRIEDDGTVLLLYIEPAGQD